VPLAVELLVIDGVMGTTAVTVRTTAPSLESARTVRPFPLIVEKLPMDEPLAITVN
jgi:hypothetical protein